MGNISLRAAALCIAAAMAWPAMPAEDLQRPRPVLARPVGWAKARGVGDWPFVVPSVSEARGSPHKVFAHYFPPFPLSFENAPPEADYYARNYLSPDGEHGKFASGGGYLRERPLPRPPLQGSDWDLQDLEQEVAEASAIGIDGFFCDIIEADGTQWDRFRRLLDAAHAVDQDFRIVPMFDMEGIFRMHPERLVPALRSIAHAKALYHLADGRLVASAFDAQNMPPNWWQDRIVELAAAGIRIAFVPCFQSLDRHFAEYAPLCYGITQWGMRTPSVVNECPDFSALAHSRGLIWMAPVSPQDMRPKDLCFWEAEGSLLYRTMWKAAIDHGSDWVQIITWNDYSESTEIEPSTETGFAFSDLTAYYIAWLKAGRQPRITRDAIYYFHRMQPIGAPIPVGERRFHLHLSATGVDIIEMLAFLRAPAVLRIRSGNLTHELTAEAGLVSFAVPLAPGTPSFAIIRDGREALAIASAWSITAAPDRQDYLYHAGGILGPP